jgi:hypothetical protein
MFFFSFLLFFFQGSVDDKGVLVTLALSILHDARNETTGMLWFLLVFWQ